MQIVKLFGAICPKKAIFSPENFIFMLRDPA